MKKIANSFVLWFVIILSAGLIIFIIWSFNHPSEFIINNINSKEAPSNTSFREPINILFLGIAGDGSRGALLTDTIFVAHLDLKQKKIFIISIPRDLWVEVPKSNYQSKINALYLLNNKNATTFSKATSYNLIQEKIEEITGLQINYIFIFDLQGFGKVVDALGGINIYLDKPIIDPLLTNPHNTSEIFNLSAGWHYLDGATAIKFVRTRYAPNGDFYRINNQHIIISALRDKINQLSNVWNLITWFKIWQSISNHYFTNLDFNTAWELFNIFKNAKTNQIKYLTLSNQPPNNLLISSSIEQVNDNATSSVYILLPKEGFEQYQQIQQYIKNTINE